MQKQFHIILGVTEPEHYLHHLLHPNSCHWEPGVMPTLPQGHAFTSGQIRSSTGPSLPPFPFCLLSPCHVLFLFSDFIQGKPHFWVKLPIFWTKINRIFYVAHHRKIVHLLVQTPSQLDNHIPKYKHVQTDKLYKNTNSFEFW